MSYPSFPWHLRPLGVAWASVHLVDVDVARRYVPPALRVVCVLPGHTLGGLFLVHYGPGSVLEYRELVACPAIVWHEGHPVAWVSHVYVDSVISRQGGREALGVPKALARFHSSPDDPTTTVITGEDGRLCVLRFHRTFGLWRQRIRFRAAHLHAEARSDGPLVSVHGNELTARLLLGRAVVEIPPESPLGGLGLGRPLVAVGAENAEAVFGGAPFHPHRTIPAERA